MENNYLLVIKNTFFFLMILGVPEHTSLLSRSCLPAGPEHFKSHSSVPKFGAQFAYVAASLREYLAQHIVTQQVPSTERCSLTDCECSHFCSYLSHSMSRKHLYSTSWNVANYFLMFSN